MLFSEILKNPNFIITLAVFLGSAAGVGLIAWQDKKPRQTLTPSMIPTVPAMLALGIVALLALVHLVNLFGVHTGR
jgi:amino acid transporter